MQGGSSAEQFRAWCENSSSARKFSQCAKIHSVHEISRMRENFTHARISSASHFRPRKTSFCIFSNFTLDVILMSSYVYVISFVTEHYISSVKLVANKSIFQYRDETFGSSFPTFLLLSHFLSFSRHPNTP